MRPRTRKSAWSPQSVRSAPGNARHAALKRRSRRSSRVGVPISGDYHGKTFTAQSSCCGTGLKHELTTGTSDVRRGLRAIFSARLQRTRQLLRRLSARRPWGAKVHPLLVTPARLSAETVGQGPGEESGVALMGACWRAYWRAYWPLAQASLLLVRW